MSRELERVRTRIAELKARRSGIAAQEEALGAGLAVERVELAAAVADGEPEKITAPMRYRIRSLEDRKEGIPTALARLDAEIFELATAEQAAIETEHKERIAQLEGEVKKLLADVRDAIRMTYNERLAPLLDRAQSIRNELFDVAVEEALASNPHFYSQGGDPTASAARRVDRVWGCSSSRSQRQRSARHSSRPACNTSSIGTRGSCRAEAADEDAHQRRGTPGLQHLVRQHVAAGSGSLRLQPAD